MPVVSTMSANTHHHVDVVHNIMVQQSGKPKPSLASETKTRTSANRSMRPVVTSFVPSFDASYPSPFPEPEDEEASMLDEQAPGGMCPSKDYRSGCPSGWTYAKFKGYKVCKRIIPAGSNGDPSKMAEPLPTQPKIKRYDNDQSTDDAIQEQMRQQWLTSQTPAERQANQRAAALANRGANADSADIEPPVESDPRPDAEGYMQSVAPSCRKKYKIMTAWDLQGSEGGGGAKQIAYFRLQGIGWRQLESDNEITPDSIRNKRGMEQKCHFSWPCASSGGWSEDFSALARNTCPQGWKFNPETGVCLARETRTCEKITESVFLNKQAKCETCSKSYEGIQHCHLYNSSGGDTTGCKLEKGHCVAKYKGPCLGEKTLWFYTPRMKLFFSKICNVHWPMKQLSGPVSRADTNRMTEIEKVAMADLDKAKQQEYNDVLIQAFQSTSGILGKVFGTMFKNFKQSGPLQALFRAMRGVAESQAVHDSDLPGDCIRDYDSHCPVGWDEDDRGFCSAPPSYTGLCPSRISFVPLTNDMKRSAAGHCDFAWPCKGELHVPSFHVFL
ncbi:unnamed protein product [Amoebophrya sp. A25]|nr:unnamed protein product [Amoebophrya sp. A25]|eukprot:GSA25T00018025001.1